MKLNPSRPRRYPRLWIFSLTFGAILYYFLIREAFVPKVITPGQQAFIIVYSLLISGIYTIGITRMLLGATPPQWLNTLWKRMLIGMTAALALTGLFALIPLPKFYGNVLQHTVVFLIVPLFIGGRTRITHFLDDRQSSTSITSSQTQETEQDLVLHMSRRKAVFVLVGSSVFVAAGWICIVFFGLGILAGLLMLIPGFACLRVERNGLTMRHSWREYTFLWTEISDLIIVNGPQGPRVAFNFNRPGARRSGMLREMYDRDMVLVDNYGLSAKEMCALLQSRKAAATDVT
jgi:hypothetical protein